MKYAKHALDLSVFMLLSSNLTTPDKPIADRLMRCRKRKDKSLSGADKCLQRHMHDVFESLVWGERSQFLVLEMDEDVVG